MSDSPLIHATPLHFSKEQGAQGLQAFAFGVVKVNDDHPKPRFKRKLMGLNLKTAYVPNCV